MQAQIEMRVYKGGTLIDIVLDPPRIPVAGDYYSNRNKNIDHCYVTEVDNDYGEFPMRPVKATVKVVD